MPLQRSPKRRSGVLLHPTSLGGPRGVGELGVAARQFVQFLHDAGQTYWQMLPVGPVGGGNSPYDSPSSFAGSSLLLDLEPLVERGWLPETNAVAPERLAGSREARFGPAALMKNLCLRAAFAAFERSETKGPTRQRLEAFQAENTGWLGDHALFSAIRREQGFRPWYEWPEPLRCRDERALEEARERLAPELAYQTFVQFLFEEQWSRLRDHAKAAGVELVGDIPMYVRYDGADVWANQSLFHLDELGRRTALAGVPPDYFSAEGQLWGNPVYRWSALRETGYQWWLERLQMALHRFDLVRLDHFIAFHRAWHVPPGAPSAREGHFDLVPGDELLAACEARWGALPFVAEDLGTVTPEVQALRDRFSLPGMRVLQFAFSEEASNHQPHLHPENMVAYTGTHDNDTAAGWLSDERKRRGDGRWVYERLASYLHTRGLATGDAFDHWTLLELVMSSQARTAIFPIQDVLGLGSEARMNIPGQPFGNWRFRLAEGALTPELAARLGEMSARHARTR